MKFLEFGKLCCHVLIYFCWLKNNWLFCKQVFFSIFAQLKSFFGFLIGCSFTILALPLAWFALVAMQFNVPPMAWKGVLSIRCCDEMLFDINLIWTWFENYSQFLYFDAARSDMKYIFQIFICLSTRKKVINFEISKLTAT